MYKFFFSLILLFAAIGCVPEKPKKSQSKQPMETAPKSSPTAMQGGLDIEGMLAHLPDGWTRTTPSSSMRLAEVTLKAAPGDTANAQLAFFHFPGTGGDAKMNLERWQSQFTGPKGEPGKDVAKTDTMHTDGITIITTDITGIQLPGGMGMGPSKPMPDSRMIASVIETPAGNWFVKITGPQNTMVAHAERIRDFLKRAKLTQSSSA